jgi:hypothetical protein
VAAALLPTAVAAQTCVIPHPAPLCRRLWITESGARWPLSHPTGAADRQEFYWSFGMARNLGRASAVGLVLTLGTDYVESGTFRLALLPRYRRWLSPLVVDVGAGPILAGSGGGSFGVQGISTHASLGYRGLLAFDAGYDAHRRNITGRTTDAYLGVRFGSLPGIVVGFVTPILLIVRALGNGPD